MKKTWSTLVSFSYGICTVFVFVLLVALLARSDVIVFPESMLPMELYELASVWLALWFAPMLCVTVLLHREQTARHKKLRFGTLVLLYLPATVCLACTVCWMYIWGVGLGQLW